MTNIEIYGYISMAVVLISCLVKDIKSLRIWNLLGCAMFVVYGYLIDSMPTVIMNVVIIFIHLYHLRIIWKSK